MKLLVLLLVVIAILYVRADHLIVGNIADRVVLGHHELIEYNAIPFVKRVKLYFFSDPQQRIIQGIQALDTLHSKASINITAGGVGQSYVNLRLKSERGWGLSYDLGIYLNDNLYQRIPMQ